MLGVPPGDGLPDVAEVELPVDLLGHPLGLPGRPLVRRADDVPTGAVRPGLPGGRVSECPDGSPRCDGAQYATTCRSV